jgi:hypothetical protein
MFFLFKKASIEIKKNRGKKGLGAARPGKPGQPGPFNQGPHVGPCCSLFFFNLRRVACFTQIPTTVVAEKSGSMFF